MTQSGARVPAPRHSRPPLAVLLRSTPLVCTGIGGESERVTLLGTVMSVVLLLIIG